MSSYIFGYFKRLVWLLPIVSVVFFCFYFMNLFARIEHSHLERQLDERNTIVDFAKFIKTKTTFFKYLDIIDRFEDNNVYLLDDKLKLVDSQPSTRKCLYLLNNTQLPFEDKEIAKEMLAHKEGSFIHSPSKNEYIEFQYKHLTKEKQKYILLIGIRPYPKTLEDKELQVAIGLLLLFTAVFNWMFIAYAKHIRYMCHYKNKTK